MTKKQKRMLMKIIIAAIIYAIGLLMESGGAVRFTIYLAGYLIIGYDVLLRAAKISREARSLMKIF